EKESVKVLIQAIQRHPLKHLITHVDLRQVKMDQAIDATVSLEFIGEAPVVKTYGALLMHNLDSVEVRCLPTALVSSIVVDLSNLREIGDGITVGNLVVPEGIEMLTESDVSIVITKAQQTAEEEAATNAAGGAADNSTKKEEPAA
ncbi:MAG: 50S ribosomal protein L25, partial [Patescibacteria group bacterium]